MDASVEKEPWLDEHVCARISYYMGWLTVLAAISQAPALIAGFQILPVMSRVGWVLIGFTLPAVLLLLAGGVSLIYDKTAGYYLVYVAILFGAIGGLGASIIPGLKLLLKGT